MIFQYSLLLIFCSFTALSVSTETCGKDLLVGTSCIMKLPEKYNDKSNEIKWTHLSSNAVIERKNKKRKSNTPGLTMEEDGSLRFQSVRLKDTGTFTYTVTSADGTEIAKDKVEIKVYEKVPKPTVKINCTADGNATLTCDVGNSKDPSLTVSWYEDGKLIQNEIKPQVFLSSTQIQENKPYSCETHNPVSEEQSESVTVSCGNLGHDYSDDWIMVGITAGGGALLLFLVICAYRSCQRSTKHQQDDDLTLSHTGTNRSKQTARGQLASPILEEDPMPRRPSLRTPPQPKAQIRARPPPQDEDEEDPTPIPRPRTKKH